MEGQDITQTGAAMPDSIEHGAIAPINALDDPAAQANAGSGMPIDGAE